MRAHAIAFNVSEQKDISAEDKINCLNLFRR